MSSLLEEAFVDAKEIKEAARQQAQAELIEQYSTELDSKMNKILEGHDASRMFEADGDEFEDDLGDLDLDNTEGAEGADALDDFNFDNDIEAVDNADTDFIDKQVPYAFSDGENLCPCPEDEEEIEINFNDLVGSSSEEEELGGIEEPEGREDFMSDMEDDELFEELGLDEEILETLMVDTDGDSSGWAPEPASHVEKELDQFLANLANDEEEVKSDKTGKKDVTREVGPYDKIQDKEDVKKENLHLEQIKKYEKQIEVLNNKLQKSIKTTSKLKEFNDSFRNKLEEAVGAIKALHLENKKLNYQKCVFENASLNERQKSKLVEAISSASNESEAETIYKFSEVSLAPTVTENRQETGEKVNPLQEALNKRPKAMLNIKRQSENLNESKDNSTKSHWQKLAGIKQ